MPAQRKRVVLSRFFNNNVELVANMCPICYGESVDVRIISVNFSFLKQVDSFKNNKLNHFKILSAINHPVIVKEGSFGFSMEEINASVNHFEKLNRVIKDEEEAVGEFEKDLARVRTDNTSTFFSGFSAEDIQQSSGDHKKFVKACEQVRFKIYKRVSLRLVHKIYDRRAAKKSLRRNKMEGKTDVQGKSKYFKIELKQDESQSRFFPISVVTNNNEMMPSKEGYSKEHKIEAEKCKHSTNDLQVCPSVKTEHGAIDYESEYFNTLNKLTPEGLMPKKEGFEYDAVKHVPPWIPPRSPHNLIEEVLYHDPWALLVATIFLNKTSCMCARPYVFWFLKENPDPFAVLEQYPESLEKYFVNLGLYKRRAVQVWRMSHDFVYKDWRNVKDLYGIGEYGCEAFRMFCMGDFDVEPKDRFLRIYKAWYEKVETKKGACVGSV